MARNFLPSTGALRAFESAGRHNSFSKAANELHLTQGAVSRQIRQLELWLGLDLFERVGQRVFLTDAGRSYLKDMQRLLGELSAATQKVMARAEADETLNLGVLPTFATRWLLPRLPAFLAEAPRATVNFAVRLEPFSFADDPLDAAIHHGEPNWPGAICERLCGERVFAVASPALRQRLGLHMPADLLGAPLLHQSTRPTSWRDWLSAQDLDSGEAFRGQRFDQFAMIAQAAAAGLGVALVPRFLIEEELATGRLEILFDLPYDSGTGYWYVYPEAKAGSRLVRQFGSWLAAATA